MNAVDEGADGSDPMEVLFVTLENNREESFTRYRLQETLMLMGCRPKDAVVVTKEAFLLFNQFVEKQKGGDTECVAYDGSAVEKLAGEKCVKSRNEQNGAALPWRCFYQSVYGVLARLNYTKPYHLLDLEIAKEVTQRNQAFIVLLGGTSGTGKSTLASLLAARLRLTTVLPTDSIRHILRSYTSREESPCAFVSTYQAGNSLPAHVVDELKKLEEENGGNFSAARLHKRKVLRGYKLQSSLVLEKLDRVLTEFENRKQSLVVEGVHLNSFQMIELVQRHPTCIPFVIYISNELKHRERFAVRGRHMTIDPQQNKYIKYFDNIRIIQTHLCKYADEYLIPKIDNTNVDRSLATIHSTLVRILRPMYQGKKLVDPELKKMVLLSREHESAIKKAWSSKGVRKAMRPLFKQKVSKRLLLRRLLAEQTMNAFGAPSTEQDEVYSSDDELQVPAPGSRRRNIEFADTSSKSNSTSGSMLTRSAMRDHVRIEEGDDGDDECEGDEADVNDDDEQATVVGSLVSATTTGKDALNDVEESRRVLFDEIDKAAATLPEGAGNAQVVRSLSAAIQRAAAPRTRNSKMTVNWRDNFNSAQSSEATFSDILDNFQGSGTSPFYKLRQKWKVEERRKTWMAGDIPPHSARSRTTDLNAVPPNILQHADSEKELLEHEKSSTESMIHHRRQGPSLTILDSNAEASARRRYQLCSRRVRSLPPDALDELSVQDFEMDSISVAATNDQHSDTSSQRDECISPLEQSVDEMDSHFEISSASSDDERHRMNETRASMAVCDTQLCV